ncbi:MAG: DNA-directed RNA polymerase subunit beta, partial [Erysipelotrichaceae bacterium]|nr:DNA-directed RNA polymerase subunit beta [Erysipelotrichaceae bacterium]
MTEKQHYHIVESGRHSTRRDYSKVGGALQLPNLVEIQTDSFRWFTEEGIREVFDDIYPIQNYGGNIRLHFLSYEFGKPKYDIAESRFRETNYAAPLKAKMELEMVNQETGEVFTKSEDVFLGDFPMMTPAGTFIINGAERVVVSQIVRSPGAYFDTSSDDKTGREVFSGELIPGRGTWLEFMSDDKKSTLGRIVNMSVDRKRKILSTILLKTIGFALDYEKGEDAFSTQGIRKFLEAFGRPYYEDLIPESAEREFQNIYEALYTSFFGPYEEIVNTLEYDKPRTRQEALIAMYENQKSDEVPTTEGAITLMNSKFFDQKKYDLTKAGRYKLKKKLNVIDRMEGEILHHDILSASGEVVMKKGTRVTRKEREELRSELGRGSHVEAFPMAYQFSHPDKTVVPVSDDKALLGRVLANDVVLSDRTVETGTVLIAADIKAVAK